ncbi:MAG: WYL domain-containing protein [Rothia mucilaginosa]|uniref:WYL domain-containing protein n=1 Tax=Rothia mucilaginosa TaxID=43675 RepID=A0A930L517_9MICC|nr:WYL domain-containing protein [Rothia mucilaginosa]MBF1657658.1 WYL domain-containing protein [Rothia mucilaginosa]
MSTAAQLYMTLHRLATAAEAPDAATRTQGISRNELLTLLGISTRANGSLSEAQERAFERAKQTLRDAGARITHVTTDLGERYRLEPSNAAKLPAWNPTAEEFRLINTILRGWEGTELQDDAYRILRKIALTSENLTDEALAAAKILEPKTGKRQRAKNLYTYREPLQRIYFSDNPHLNELFTAYAERKTVTFTYQTAAGATRVQEKVSVAGIGYRYGTWYFVGYYTESAERKEYTFRASRIQKLTMLSRIDSTPINATFKAKNWLEDIKGYEESLIVAEVSADSTLSEPFTVPSYGTIDSAVAATSYSCVIEPPEESEAASTRQRDSYAAQQQLLRTLTDLHSGAVEDPGTWADINQRNRNNSLDDLVDLLLGLHRADRWASAHDEAPMPLNQLNALYSVDTEKNRALGKTIAEIFAQADTVPFESDPKDPDALKPTYINLLPDFDGATPNTLLNYARLTDTELAILVFTLSAADILHPADARLGSIRAALAAAYPNAPVYAQHLCFAPEEPLLQEATAALSSGNAVTIGYGTSERAADRLVDPYALVLHRDHMYLHAWCRTAEERYYAARGEEVPEYVLEAFAHAATGETADSQAGNSAAADNEAGEKTPTFWRNFRLTRINHIQEAGAGRAHPVTGDTVPHWHAQQHSTQTNPFAELRIHPTEHIPSGEPLDTLTATYMRRSTHHVKKASRTQYVRIHYYNNAHGAGDKNILDTVIAHRGALELVGPAHLRAALLDQLQTLKASSRRGAPAGVPAEK